MHPTWIHVTFESPLRGIRQDSRANRLLCLSVSDIPPSCQVHSAVSAKAEAPSLCVFLNLLSSNGNPGLIVEDGSRFLGDEDFAIVKRRAEDKDAPVEIPFLSRFYKFGGKVCG